jgi:hypothetical protein
MRPAVIDDFDGDEDVEFAISRCGEFILWDIDAQGITPLWTTSVQDVSGAAGTTAFDFLGDGTPEPIYSDEIRARAWSREGDEWVQKLDLPRESATMMEYPTIVDVDDDGSAEILVVSNAGAPVLQVFGDANDAWIQARRIWNQQAYMVTNVNEDGTIPSSPVPNWEHFNTFRVNSQIELGDVCVPEG